MSKLPQISGKNVIQILVKIGYYIERQKGSHIRLKHSCKEPISVPNHKVLDKGLLRRIIKDADLTTEEFLKLLKK